MSSFNYYQHITYNDEKARNIISHAEIKKNFIKDYTTYFTYIVKDGERADMIAFDQYGDSRLDWILYIINDITDPYKDWVMEEKQFNAYLEAKYNTTLAKLSSKNLSIAYYYYDGLDQLSGEKRQADINAHNYTMSEETYNALAASNELVWNSVINSYITATTGWKVKTIYDHEYDINESKREILILRPQYIEEFKTQFRDLFNNVKNG